MNSLVSENYTLEEGLDIIQERLAMARKEILHELKKQNKNMSVEIISRGGCGRGSYKCYFWIDVIVELNARYRIALFCNDVDKRSGNFHTKLGEIQFWKNIKNGKYIGSANKQDSSGNWYLCMDNAQNPKLKVDGPGYTAQGVVKKFLKYVEKEESLRKKNGE